MKQPIAFAAPDRTKLMRCKVEAGGGKASDALKLYCVVRTAKEGHHASCSAERNSPSCNGVEKVYSYDGPMPEDWPPTRALRSSPTKSRRSRNPSTNPKVTATRQRRSSSQAAAR